MMSSSQVEKQTKSKDIKLVLLGWYIDGGNFTDWKKTKSTKIKLVLSRWYVDDGI